MESPSSRPVDCASSSRCSANIDSKKLTVGRSSTSSHTIGLSDVLPWSCAAQLAVITKSPGFMMVFSPSTAV